MHVITTEDADQDQPCLSDHIYVFETVTEDQIMMCNMKNVAFAKTTEHLTVLFAALQSVLCSQIN